MADEPSILTTEQYDQLLKRFDDRLNAAVAEARHTVKPLLMAGVMYKMGDFSVMLNEETGELKITTLHPSKHLEIRPKTDNSIEIKSCR